jgi:hydroxymethylpyrimidine/phosphomethylpyrimidine kinase
VAANLAAGHGAATAAEKAKAYVTGAIEHGLDLGRGRGMLDHFWNRG